MARRPGGLGGQGRQRFLETLGKPTQGQDVLFRDLPPLQTGTPLTTGWIGVDSSRLTSYMYDYSTGTLSVKWLNRPSEIWEYNDVSSAIFEAFASAPSKGKYVNSTLNFHNYHRVQ